MYSRNRGEIPASRRSLLASLPGRSALLWIVAFSVSINMLLLVLPLYTIEVFDRVITSGSVETLVGLTVIAAIALVFSAAFETLRSRLLSRFAVRFEQHLAPIVLESTIVDATNHGDGRTHDLARVRELRTFLSSATVAALLDAPFLPAFILILFVLHPWYGVIALIGTAILLIMGIVSRWIARAEIAQAHQAAQTTQATLDGIVRHSGVVRAMGWTKGAIREFMDLNDQALSPVVRASERVYAIGAMARMVRTILQVAAIAAGAWLVLQNEVLAGSLIAASILISRTLQPMEGLISAWRALASAHDAWKQVQAAAAPLLVRRRRTLLPSPSGRVEVKRMAYRMAAVQRPILAGISFECQPAEIVVIIGPTGAGKSTLLRLMAGLERPSVGTIRLDDAALHDWDPDQLGQFVGYLPQDVQLLGGTVAEAIAGFDEYARDEDIVAAAQLAQAHEMILSLPDGYQTEIGRDGSRLSGGQRQRIGLARAFFGDRKLILLDEPNANLDPDGEQALCSAIELAKARGATVVIVTHRPRLLTIADAALLLRDGAQLAFGPPAEVLRLPAPSPAAKPHVVRLNVDHQKLAVWGTKR